MDYRKIYYSLIEKRRVNPITRGMCYCEEHHVLPRSLGGKDEADNLVLLTAREHFVAHLLLAKMYLIEKGENSKEYRKMAYALWYLLGKHKRKRLVISSRKYEKMKQEFAKVNSKEHRGERHWHYGQHWDEETKEKIRRAHIGKKVAPEHLEKYRRYGEANNNYGHKWSEESKKMMSQKKKGVKLSEQALLHLRQYRATHPNPMTGVNVRDRMSPEAYQEMLRKRSETMKRRYAAMPIRHSPYENKTKEEIEKIRERQRLGHKKRWEQMTEEEREVFREKKRHANRMSQLSRQMNRIGDGT